MKIIHIFFFLLINYTLHSQIAFSKTLGKSDGFHFQHATCLFQDSKGYIWIGSNNEGIAQFNGNRFYYFAEENELTKNAGTEHIFEENNAIYFFNYNENILKYAKQQFSSLHYFSQANENDYSNYGIKDWYSHQLVRKSDSIYLLKNEKITKKIPAKTFLSSGFPDNISMEYEENTAIFMLYAFTNSPAAQIYRIETYDENTLRIVNTYHIPVQYANARHCKLLAKNRFLLNNEKDIYYFDGTNYKVLYKAHNLSYIIQKYKEGYIYIDKVADNQYDIIDINNNGSYEISHIAYGKELVNVIKTQDNNYMALAKNEILIIYPHIFHFAIPEKNSNNLQIEQLNIDKDGKIWISTFSNGVKCIANYQFVSLPAFLENTNQYTFLQNAENDEMLWVYRDAYRNENRGLMRFDGTNKPEYHAFGTEQGTMPTMLFYLTESKKLFAESFSYNYFFEKEITAGDWEMNEQDWTLWNKNTDWKQRVFAALIEDKYGGILAGQKNSIAYLCPNEVNKVTTFSLNLPQKYNQAEKIWESIFPDRDTTELFGFVQAVKDSHQNIWFSTDYGLRFYNYPNGDYFQPKDCKKISDVIFEGNKISALQVWKDSLLLIGTKKGLVTLDLHIFYKTGKTFFVLYDEKNGLLSEEIINICVDKQDKIWISSDKEIVAFLPKEIKNNAVFYIETKQITVINTIGKELYSFPIDSVFTLKEAEERNICFDFYPVSTSLLSSNYLVWSLFQNGNLYQSDTSLAHIVTFYALPPGEYLLKIGILGTTENKEIHFYISPKWYEIKWIQILLGLLLSGLLYAVIYMLYDLRRKKQQSLRLQVQVIANQLNPHFINNTLNWLRLRLDDDNLAINVLEKLSENIRAIFRHTQSHKSYHLLADEMQITANYLYIQQQRFGKKLTISIPEKESYEKIANINVPLLILQIHAENAVEHGIANKIGGGMVTISWVENDKNLLFYIQDNGIGREKAAILGSKGTQKGTKMLAEMIDIFNTFNSEKMYQKYHDLHNEKGEICGTKVEVCVPKNYTWEIW